MRERHAVNAALTLGAFALLGVGILAWVQSEIADRIEISRQRSLLHTLTSALPPGDYDNDLLTDALNVRDSKLGFGRQSPVYRAFKHGKPVAVIVIASAPDGYNSEIRILVAVRADGSLVGVRVLEHRETPGLGDGIELEKSA